MRTSCVLAISIALSWASAAVAQSPAEVNVVTATGENLAGELVSIDSLEAAIDTGNEVKRLPLEELSQIRFDSTPLPTLPMRVQLSGGSLLSVTGLTWDDQTVTVNAARQSPLQIPVKELQWVRFRMGTPATNPTWLGWVEEQRRADRLAVRRNEKSLDSIDGTVTGITRTAVQFQMRGNEIEAPIAKLEGVLLSTQNAESPSAPIQVTDTSGSVWNAESVRLSNGGSHLQVQLAGSIQHDVPLNQIETLQFAGGILPLSEAEIASSSFGNASSQRGREQISVDMQNWFSPDTSDGVIHINAPGQIVFRIPDGYEKLVVAARRADAVNQFMGARLEVLLDDQLQWSGVLQDRKSLGLELPLGEARLLCLKASPLPSSDTSGEDLSNNDDPTTPLRSGSSINSSPSVSEHDLSGTLGGTIEWFSGRLLK
ncbi:MAG: glycosyl hydrolase family 98 [Rhodopirellula sp. JB044]|uniref:glycosyl hydrolase family 98 n=1 Tax=Rhodopirellula sp. JB044 TaxID=3342844 RepID=UPI00370B29B6